MHEIYWIIVESQDRLNSKNSGAECNYYIILI